MLYQILLYLFPLYQFPFSGYINFRYIWFRYISVRYIKFRYIRIRYINFRYIKIPPAAPAFALPRAIHHIDQTRPLAAVATVTRRPISLSSNFLSFNLGHRKRTLNCVGSTVLIGYEDLSFMFYTFTSLSYYPICSLSQEVCLHNVLSWIGRGPRKRHVVGIQSRRQLRKG